MADRELTEEEIMLDDKDPMDAIREIRIAEGVDEEDLPEKSDDHAAGVLEKTDETVDEDQEKEDAEEVQNAQGAEDAKTDEEVNEDGQETKEQTEVAGEDDTADGTDDDEGTDSEAEGATSEEKQGPVGRKFKANGQEFEFSNEEILEQFETVFGQAMNYTQKMQKIAPYRKMISALEQEGVTSDALNLAIDALKGDKGAIKKILEQNKIDGYDLTSDEEDTAPYIPKTYGKNETQLEIEEITSKIQGDEEFKITTNVIDEQWDGASRQQIADNPRMIEGLHNDIKTGLYDKVAPMAMKMKVLDGNSKSDIEYYMLAGQQFAQQLEKEAKTQEGQSKVDELNADAQGADSKFDKASSEANRKRSATSTGARADRKGVIDYLDDDDEAYEAWYNKLQSSV
jgi:hypothetical protein